LEKVDPRTERQLIFRNWFLEGDDSSIAVVVSNYFDAVREKWPDNWSRPEPGQVLSRTTGYLALARLLGDIYLEISSIGEVPTKAEFAAKFQKASLPEANISSENFLPGSAGQGHLYRVLKAQILEL
jgi:hypothetical protein